LNTDTDRFDLARFVEAQETNYEDAFAEITAGQKRTHWCWYVFPQVAGLGSSAMSVRYAISGAEEAKAYLAHPLLGARLLQCVAAMSSRSNVGAAAILGQIDARKFHSCLTLFAQVSERDSLFHVALRQFFGSAPDAATVAVLSRREAP
jgi:uncharacterized protein (DUF1810 family)